MAATLDTETQAQAKAALAEIQAGADFAKVAAKYSDDQANKGNGGEFGFLIDQTNRDLSAQTTAALFQLGEGEVSEIVNIGYALEIVKVIETTGNRVRGAHILFNFKDIGDYVNDLKERQPARLYVTLPPPSEPTQNENAPQP